MQKEDLLASYNRIAPYVHKTPVLQSSFLNTLSGAEIFFKCENFQRMGAFKMRGATNAILQLNDTQRDRGVVTHSSGNFAQAVSLAAKCLGVKATIVMPRNAPQVKKNAVTGYGGTIIECDPSIEAREATLARIVAKTRATFIHPSNDLDVILGNASCAMELLDKHHDLDVIFAPVGGGGLIAGTALAAYSFGNNCAVVGGEPLAADDAYRSLRNGKIETNASTNTIADGLRTHLGTINFPIIKEHVNKIVRVAEDEIIAALRLIYERMKIVVEPSSAVAFAAFLKDKKNWQGKSVGVLLSGGNVDFTKLPF